MSEWLTRATEALRGEKEPEPQPFEIDCECGTHHGGFRRRRHQRIICRSCGTALFVLAYDSYPPPLAPQPRKKKKQKRSARASARHKSDNVTAQAAVDAGRVLATKAVRGVSEASARMATRTTDTGRGLWQRTVATAQTVVRFWTPFRIVLLCIVLAVGVTALLTMRSGANEAAIARLIQSDENARQALADGEIGLAREQFTAAVAALDQLDRHTDPLACEIRQLHRETIVMQELLAASVFDVAMEAEEALAAGELEEFRREFRIHHHNRWLVVEGPVARVARSPQGGYYRLEIPAAIGAEARSLVISGRLAALDSLKFRDSQRVVILAGQLRNCELSSDRGSWVLRLNPETAFLWADAANYAALGLTSPDEEHAAAIRQILATQSLANGIPHDRL